MVTDLISKRKPGVVPFVSHTPTKTGAITKDDTHPLQGALPLRRVVSSQSSRVCPDVHPDYVQGPIAQLAHGIDRVLFNPGVHWIRDPHSGVFNFTPYLQTVPDVREFDFNRLYPYVRSSEDDTMRKLAIREGKRYIGSSSSMTGALSHIYRLISGEKPVNLSSLTMAFANEPDNFSAGQVIPVTVRITQKDGIYTLDPDSSDPEDNERHILLWLGTMLEKFLTKTPEQFSQLTRSAPPLAQPPRKETYRYSKSSKFVMRGQLDCVDSRLPGTGVFDIKTRASVLVRLDRFNMDSFAGYEIRTQHGLFESFEREEYDMIRSAFLKYIFQARIGKMDGCIVAYHNTHKLMGFQYFPVEAMEERVYGASGIGERVFLQSLMLLEAILDVAVSIFPDLPISVMFDKVEKTSKMSVFVRPTQGFDPRSVPLALLVVDCQAWLGPIVTNRAKAIVRNRDDLKLEYTIKRYNGTQKAIADLYSGALDRQDLGFPLAPGQSKDDMVTMYRDYNALGKTLTQEQKERVSDMTFYPASSKVKEIRALATKGMHRLQQLDETSLEKPHVVWQPLMYVGSGEADGGADQQITSPT
ncbi:Pet127-domain-containing protein [Auriculariales sp. MPI-PUGE-AT-0066]|nr:Pet127-domain-containing protein [Auriculariales sp. MPI-PUGE-AT-0066]